jgi:hypothetical protein
MNLICIENFVPHASCRRSAAIYNVVLIFRLKRMGGETRRGVEVASSNHSLRNWFRIGFCYFFCFLVL